MMFLLLVVVFSKLSNRWWLFLLIGYGKVFYLVGYMYNCSTWWGTCIIVLLGEVHV